VTLAAAGPARAAGIRDANGDGRLAVLRDGLGFLPGSACPHYDGEDRRLIAEEGFAAKDAAALVFGGVAVREVVCTVAGSTAYRVEAGGEERALAARLL
jgi:dipeptidase E